MSGKTPCDLNRGGFGYKSDTPYDLNKANQRSKEMAKKYESAAQGLREFVQALNSIKQRFKL